MRRVREAAGTRRTRVEPEEERLFKKLTPENWLEVDSGSTHFVSIGPDGVPKSITSERWAEEILALEMPDTIPRPVRDVFEVARGTLCYGCFFYPLYALGSEQCFRVMETALRHKCRDLEAPAHVSKGFKSMVEWLVSRGAIEKTDELRWDAARRLRNAASHPDRQSIVMPTMAVNNLDIAVEMTSALFRA